MIVATPAIVLKRFPYRENSIIARCFTRELGRLGIIIHGAHRKKGSTAAYFQPLNYLDLVLYYKQTRELQTVSKVAFQKPWQQLTTNLKKIAYGFAILDMVDRCLSFQDAHPDLFDEVAWTLETLESQEDHLNLLFWYFQYRLLTLLGFKPDFSHSELDYTPLPNPYASPNSRRVFELFEAGKPGLDQEIRITAEDRKLISDYLFTHLKVHFEGIHKLESLRILREVLV